MKKLTKPIIRLTRLNNKSRKGVYVYIKEPNKHARYYKYKGQAGEITAYRKQYITKKKTTAKEYLKKIQKRPTIKKLIEKGMTTATIKDFHKATNLNINKAKEKLLKPLIRNKRILKIMMEDQNFNKLKERMQFIAIAKDENNKTLLKTEKFNKTIKEIERDIKDDLMNKMSSEIGSPKVNLSKWKNTNKFSTGTIKKIDLKIIFRKG